MHTCSAVIYSRVNVFAFHAVTNVVGAFVGVALAPVALTLQFAYAPSEKTGKDDPSGKDEAEKDVGPSVFTDTAAVATEAFDFDNDNDDDDDGDGDVLSMPIYKEQYPKRLDKIRHALSSGYQCIFLRRSTVVGVDDACGDDAAV
jgi:hypothetical protein